MYVYVKGSYIYTHIYTEAKKDITYTLERLIKGLSSSRESARLGFVSCLVQILIQFPNIQLHTIMMLIEDHTKLTGIHIHIYIYTYTYTDIYIYYNIHIYTCTYIDILQYTIYINISFHKFILV